ncbi:hypothetical protein RRF57_002924 [Xylaria bambusicola]|uniref:Uncharacterized protein n=1 Tax=Xylaria bambusicola TaxID=326684 RepID=A0AAN7UJQ9_9PEZI
MCRYPSNKLGGLVASTTASGKEAEPKEPERVQVVTVVRCGIRSGGEWRGVEGRRGETADAQDRDQYLHSTAKAETKKTAYCSHHMANRSAILIANCNVPKHAEVPHGNRSSKVRLQQLK